MLAGASLERFQGERVLLAVGLTRAVTAGLCALVIATDVPGWPLYALAAIAAAAGAPVRPTQATLMPAVARSPRELVAANMAWTTGEGLGSMIGHLLREVSVFGQLPLTAFERLAGGLEPLSFAAGETIMREGEPGDRFVVIESGGVEVSAEGRPMTRLGRGAGLGEISLLRRSPRTATVTALTDVTAFAIPGACFVAAISGPAAAAVTERIVEASMQRRAAAVSEPRPGTLA